MNWSSLHQNEQPPRLIWMWGCFFCKTFTQSDLLKQFRGVDKQLSVLLLWSENKSPPLPEMSHQNSVNQPLTMVLARPGVFFRCCFHSPRCARWFSLFNVLSCSKASETSSGHETPLCWVQDRKQDVNGDLLVVCAETDTQTRLPLFGDHLPLIDILKYTWSCIASLLLHYLK